MLDWSNMRTAIIHFLNHIQLPVAIIAAGLLVATAIVLVGCRDLQAVVIGPPDLAAAEHLPPAPPAPPCYLEGPNCTGICTPCGED